MNVADTLCPMLSVVDDHAVTLVQPFQIGHRPGGHHQLSQNTFVSRLGLVDSRQPVTHLGDTHDVSRRLRGDVIEAENVVVLVHHARWDAAVEDLVEDGRCAVIEVGSGLRRRNLVAAHAAAGGVRGGAQQTPGRGTGGVQMEREVGKAAHTAAQAVSTVQ
jgi:hypothetical protein